MKLDLSPIFQDENGLKRYLVTNFRRIQDLFSEVSPGGVSGGVSGGEALLASGTLTNTVDSSVTTASVTFVDVHANLKVTGIVPANGKLKILLQGTAHATAGVRHYWGLRDATGIVVAATPRMMALSSNLANPYGEVTYYLTGLTPGAPFDYRFAFRSSAATSHFQYGGQYGAAQIHALSVG